MLSPTPSSSSEGAAIADFMKPDRVVVGMDNPCTMELLRTLYEPFTRNRDRFVVMDVRSSELTKYAANAMLATKISFMNELANIAERVGADIEKVRGHRFRPAHRLQLHLPGHGLWRFLFSERRAGAGALQQCRQLPGSHPRSRGSSEQGPEELSGRQDPQAPPG
ncbi:MAG: hypothetical protein U1F39_06050 [Steroidobacteraceae bacterium]